MQDAVSSLAPSASESPIVWRTHKIFSHFYNAACATLASRSDQQHTADPSQVPGVSRHADVHDEQPFAATMNQQSEDMPMTLQDWNAMVDGVDIGDFNLDEFVDWAEPYMATTF